MQNQTQINEGLPKAYSSKEYSFIGFFFSLIPVFMMSFANAKVLPNGELIKKKMKIFLIIFLLLFVANYGVLVWAVVHVTKGTTQNLFSNPSNYSAITNGSYGSISSGDLQFAQTIIQNGGLIFFAFNFLLLIIVIRFTNKNEFPIFQEMREAKKIQVHNMMVPVIIGIAFVVFQYMFTDQIIHAIAKMFL